MASLLTEFASYSPIRVAASADNELVHVNSCKFYVELLILLALCDAINLGFT